MSFPNLKNPYHLLATWFGIGKLRPAPGTWSSAVAASMWYFLESVHAYIFVVLPIFILFSWFICFKASEDSDSNDHSSIVIDEVAGMLVTLLFVSHEMINYFFAFLLFRLFDIWKPWPISWVDKNIKGGVGVLLDDLIAGLLAGVIIYSLFFLTLIH